MGAARHGKWQTDVTAGRTTRAKLIDGEDHAIPPNPSIPPHAALFFFFLAVLVAPSENTIDVGIIFHSPPKACSGDPQLKIMSRWWCWEPDSDNKAQLSLFFVARRKSRSSRPSRLVIRSTALPWARPSALLGMRVDENGMAAHKKFTRRVHLACDSCVRT